MILKTLFATLALPLLLLQTSESVSNSSCFKRYYKISGRLESTSFYQGGASYTHGQFSYLIPTPVANYTLAVVRVDDSTRVPEVVGQVTSDALGNFSIKLPPGKYGFVDLNEVNQLTPGQCMPKNIATSGDFSSHSSTWESNKPCPVDLTNGSVDSLVITNHIANICGMCP